MAVSYVCLAALCLLLSISGSVEGKADDSMCSEKISELLPCLSYVQGKAPAPTKECCTNLLDVHLHEPVCLCELIAASGSTSTTSNLPPMNTTLALNLGPACDVGTKPKTCPGLLGISASSPQAKIFEGGNTSAASAPSATPSPTTSGSTTSNSSSSNVTSSPNDATTLAANVFVSLIAASTLALACLIR